MKINNGLDQSRSKLRIMALTWGYGMERVTRIELALSAWEAERLPLLGGLTWQMRWPVVAVVDPSSPWLMARRSCSSPGALLLPVIWVATIPGLPTLTIRGSCKRGKV